MIKRKKLGQHFLNSKSIAEKIIAEGLGILTPLLCKDAKKVFSIDVDKDLIEEAKKNFSKIHNLTLKHGDGFKTKDRFTIFVSNLPYSKSKDAIEWLATTPFSHEIKNIFKVGKKNFTPNPKVDSVILKIIKKNSIEKDLIEILNKIFSYRRKKISNILKQFGKETSLDKRLDDLSIEEIVTLGKEIQNT
jgi:16S rRNA (adenine1518-N6/adenine1519-N6)-dimethyltransferase